MSKPRKSRRKFSLILFFLIFVFSLTLLLFAQKSKTASFKCQAPDYKCYENYYSDAVNRQGVKEAFGDLKNRYENDPFTRAMCHPLVHVIGRASSQEFTSVSEAFLHGDNFCSSGYYHGVLEGIAGKLGRDKMLASLNNICSDIKGKNVYSLDYYNCVHGLGHGLMAITDDELFDSLKYCETLTGVWEQRSCSSGVFMENIVIDGTNHTTKYLKKDDLLYPCNAVLEKFKSDCYLMQSSYILRETKLDFNKTFEACEGAEDIYEHYCYESLGRDASGFTISNIEATKDICLKGKNFDQKLGCFIGAARDFKYYFGNNDRAKKLCESSDDLNLAQDCLKAI